MLLRIRAYGLSKLLACADNVQNIVAYLECRADAVNDGEKAEAVLANAPMKEYGYFAVPKVVE